MRRCPCQRKDSESGEGIGTKGRGPGDAQIDVGTVTPLEFFMIDDKN